MWFAHLQEEDRQILVQAFKTDGFKVKLTHQSLIAEKEGQKIIVTKINSAKVIFDLKTWLFKRKLLAEQVGGIPLMNLLDFINLEKKSQETFIDCLKRLDVKLNWSVDFSGNIEDSHVEKMLGRNIQYAEVTTDNNQVFTILEFFPEGHSTERVYAINQKYHAFYRILSNLDEAEQIRDLAPNAYLMLQAMEQP